jgi:oligoendopeptidase F
MSTRSRSEIAEQHTWNLNPLFATREAWQSTADSLEPLIAKLEKHRGTLAQSAATLAAALTDLFNVRRNLERVYTFAQHSHDIDLTDPVGSELSDRATGLHSKFSQASSFFEPEILSLPAPRRAELLQEPSLKPYRRYLELIFRNEPHTLSAAEEQILAGAQEVLGTTERVFGQLNNSDLTFEPITVEGKSTAVTHGSFLSLLRHRDRSVRSDLWTAYYSSYDRHRHTFAAILASAVKRDLFLARSKRHGSARAAALFPDVVPEAVYDNLVSTVREGIQPLHQYWSVRKASLGLPEQRLFDTYVPLIEKAERKFSFEEGCDLIVNSCRPLGEEYCEVLKRGLTQERWVDVFESKGKRSGAYSGVCYDSPPYILMNYREDALDSLFTLAHEAGHSMHSYLARQAQPYQYSDYSILVAEVASTFNEQLLLRYLKEKFSNDNDLQRYLINYEIDAMKSTIFRQVMFAEYEQLIHAHAEKGGALTLEYFRETYHQLLGAYFGDSVTLQSLDTLECFRIPHFYWNFYVFKYATGLSSAIVLADRVWRVEPGAQQKYLEFLKTGGAEYPITALQRAGVDLSSPTPVGLAMDHFKVLVERFVVALGV